MNRFFKMTIGGVTLLSPLCLWGCLGSQIVMHDVPDGPEKSMTLWEVPNRPSAPDRTAIADARSQLKDHHTAAVAQTAGGRF